MCLAFNFEVSKLEVFSESLHLLIPILSALNKLLIIKSPQRTLQWHARQLIISQPGCSAILTQFLQYFYLIIIVT